MWAQGSALLTVAPPHKLIAKRGAVAEDKISIELREGYHTNSNTPNEDYLIPMRLKWEPGPLSAADVVYPKPEQRKYEFSNTPVSVFSGKFDILTRFKVDPKSPAGPGVLVGKLRYQACNDTTCFPPKTVEINLPYEIQ